MEATPDQRKQIDGEQAYKGQAAQISLENEQLRAYKEQQETSAFQNQLNTSLSSPEMTQIAQAFDSRAGKQGAFTSAVIQHGITQSRQAGRDLPISEVVADLVKTFGLTPQPNQAAFASQVVTGSNEVGQRKETLPKVQSSGGSPVAQKVRTLDDLKRLQNKSFSTGHG